MVRYVMTALLLLTVSWSEVRYEVKNVDGETIFRQYHVCYTPLGEEKRFLDGCPEGYLEEKPAKSQEEVFNLMEKVKRCRANVLQKCFPGCRSTDSSATKQECVRNCYAILGTCVDGVFGTSD